LPVSFSATFIKAKDKASAKNVSLGGKDLYTSTDSKIKRHANANKFSHSFQAKLPVAYTTFDSSFFGFI